MINSYRAAVMQNKPLEGEKLKIVYKFQAFMVPLIFAIARQVYAI